MASCPTCGKQLDARRAPVARVAGGRIVSYCSTACADSLPPVARVVGLPPTALVVAAPVEAAAPVLRRPITEPVRAEPDPDLEDARRRSITEHRRRRNRRVVWLSAGIIAGGMAVAVIQAVSPSSPGRVSAEGSADPAAVEVVADAGAPEAPPPLDAAGANARAVEVLRALLPATSARMSQEAARALSRTGDVAALETLALALEENPSEIARLEVAYALVRGGDDRGTKVLVAALRSKRRDVRVDGARYLTLLGDERGQRVLHDMLGLSDHRLGAAEALSRAGDAKALAVLDAVRANPKTTREDRLRALVALGRAGRADVAEELRGVLGDGQFNVGAAEALARLGDRAAVPVLAGQLSVPSLQVGAALGLRRLDPSLDPTPYLPALVAVLDSPKDTTRVSAAEAILVLTGPAAIVERD